jgi:hypothetical protein
MDTPNPVFVMDFPEVCATLPLYFSIIHAIFYRSLTEMQHCLTSLFLLDARELIDGVLC